MIGDVFIEYSPVSDLYMVYYSNWVSPYAYIKDLNTKGVSANLSTTYNVSSVVTGTANHEPRDLTYLPDNSYFVYWLDLEETTPRVLGKKIDAANGQEIVSAVTLIDTPAGARDQQVVLYNQNDKQAFLVTGANGTTGIIGQYLDTQVNQLNPVVYPVAVEGNDIHAARSTDAGYLVIWTISGDIYIQTTPSYNGIYDLSVLSEVCAGDCLLSNQNGALAKTEKPINTLSGSKSDQATDLMIQTATGQLTFDRYYSSRAINIYTTTLGYGWAHNLDSRLIYPDDQEGIDDYVLFKAHSASLYKFAINGDGTYSPTSGIVGELSCSGSTCSLLLPNSELYTFENRKLLTWTDSKGNSRSYTYDSTNGQLIRVTDNVSSRYISLSYTQGRISSITNSSGRNVAYEYSSSGDLISVTDANGTWHYEYSSHRLTRVINPLGQTDFRTEYDAEGRAINQYDGLGNLIVHLAYDSSGITTLTDANGNEITHTYDYRGTNINQSDAGSFQTSKTYDSNFRPILITDEADNTTSLTWSEDGVNLLQVEDTLGQLTTINYDSNNNITSTVDSANFLTQYYYENANFPTLLTRSIDALGAETSYTYDEDGNLISITDPLENTTTYDYDEYGQRTSVTNALNQITSYSYDTLGRLIDLTTPDGKVSHNVYNTAGYLFQSIQNFDSNKTQNEDSQYNITTTYEYDLMGRQTSITDTYGHETVYEYDANGQLISSIDPDGNENINTYNALGQLESTTDPMGRTTLYTYDEVGRLIETTDPAEHYTSSEYNPNGSLSASIDASGQRTTYTYDDLMRIISTTDAEGNTTHTTYDGAGNVSTSTDAEGNSISYEYDALGRQIKQTFEDESFTETFYDDAGNRIQSIDAKGNATTYAYDDLNRLITTTDALGNVTSYTYDNAGRQASITDPLENVTNYTYDSLGRQIVITFPDETTNTTSYDALGNVTQSTDAKEQTSTHTYDVLNRLISTTSPAEITTSYTYDDVGNRLSMTDGNGKTTNYQYNNLNQLIEETNALAKSTGYIYDAIGKMTSITDPSNATTSYTYDNLGRQTSIQNALDVTIEYQYDGNGNRVQMKDGRNVTTRYQYDNKGQLISVIENYRSGVTGDQETNLTTVYSYDANGNRIKINDANGHETTFVYDELNRLVSETDAVENTTSYGYDDAGNQTSKTDAMARITYYTYNSRGLLTNINYPDSTPDVSYSYDANGQRIGMQDGLGSTTWVVDSVGRATTITDPFNQTVGYSYDSIGNRTGMTYPDGKQVDYAYDDANRMITVTDWNDLITSYTYDDTNRVQAILQPSGLTTLLNRDAIGQITELHTTQNWKLLNSFEYTYDNNGNRTRVKEHLDTPQMVAPSIAVKIIDTNGALITNQLVYGYDQDTYTGNSAFTDENGIARLIMPDGIYRFGTELNGQYYYSGETNHCEVKICSETTITMPVFERVAVNVKNLEETLLSGLTVRVYSGDEDTGLSAITDASGVAVFSLLEGDYRFKVEQEGDYIFSGLENHCTITGCTEVTVVFPDFVDVVVHVADFMENVYSGTQVTTFVGDLSTQRSGTTNENGDVVISLPTGNYRFMVQVGSEQYFSEEINHCSVPECTFAEIAVPIAGFVQMLVKDTNGEPQPNVVVDVFDGEQLLEYETITDDYGRVVFELPDGSYRFKASIAIFNYFSGTENHCTVPECMSAEITVPIFNDVTVTVQDEQNNPLEDVEVLPYQGNISLDWLTYTDSTGQTLYSLPEGDYRMMADVNGQEYYSSEQNDCHIPVCESVTITVPVEQTLAVTMKNYQGNTLTDQYVYAYDGESYVDAAITDANGVAYFNLPDGSYRFQSYLYDIPYYSGAENHCTVPECSEVEFSFPEIYPVTVTVMDENDTLWANQAVYPYDDEQELPLMKYTNGNGQVTLGLAPGDYRFMANINYFPSFSASQNHCTVPTCTSATIITPIFYDVTVTVRNSSNVIQPDKFVGIQDKFLFGLTDENGQISFNLPPGEHIVYVNANNQTYFMPSCTVPTCLSVDAVIPETQDVSVTVTDENEKPISYIWVEAYDGNNNTGISAITNESGIATLNLVSGEYRFKAQYEGQASYSGSTNHCTVPTCSSADIELTDFGLVTVEVYDTNDNPVFDSEVSAYDEGNYVVGQHDTTSEGWPILLLHSGSYRFEAGINTDSYSYLYYSGETNHCTVPTCDTVTIEVPAFGTTTVTVLDADDSALTDVPVTVFDGETDTGNMAYTNQDGEVSFSLPEGSYRFLADYNNEQLFSGETNHCTIPACTEVTIQFGGQSGILSLPFYATNFAGIKGFFSPMKDETTPVTVSVVDTSNIPQADLTVYVYDGQTNTDISGITNGTGQVTLNLPAGNYRVRVDKFSGQYFSGESNHCEVPTCSSINVTLPVYGLVGVTVTDSSSTPLEGLSVIALDGSTTVGTPSSTNVNGQAVFNLPEGDYRFSTEYHSEVFYSGTTNHCEVPTCTTSSISVPVYANVTVSVVDTASEVQPGLTVTAHIGETATDVSAITNESGQANLNLKEGSYRFGVVKNGYTAFSGESNHCTVPTCSAASMTVPVFSEVTVTVVDSDNIPQGDLPVFAFDGVNQTGYSSITNENGQVTLSLPEGNYRFRATAHGLHYYSEIVNHCTTPTCTTAQVSIPKFSDVTVTLTDTMNIPQNELTVMAYTFVGEEEQFSGVSAITGTNGQAILSLPEGNYRFRTTLHTLNFNSSETYDCSTPICTTASIQVPVFGEVVVTVKDTVDIEQEGVTVVAMDGDTVTAISGITNATGQVSLALPEDEYRFRATIHGLDYFSSEVNNCSVSACTTAAIEVPIFGSVTVSVANTAATPQADLTVYAYRVVTIEPESTQTPTPEPTATPEGSPTPEPTEEPEQNIEGLTELVETGITGTTDANGQVILNLPEGIYRFRTDLNGHQYFSPEENPVTVPVDTTTSITVPVFGEVVVTVKDRDQEPQPNLPVFAYDADVYNGVSATTDGFGQARLLLPEGGYRFRADQYTMQFWSDSINHCTVPTCTTASVIVLGTDYAPNDQIIDYSYDQVNRLTAADYDSGLYYHYTYDAVGNRLEQETAFTAPPITNVYTYDNANRLTGVDEQTYTFDDNGNLLSDGEYTYTYDSANRLVGVNKTDTSVSYAYNGDGDRLKQTVNGTSENYTLDLNSGLAQVLASQSDTYLYGLNRLGFERGGQEYQYLHDALGSVRQAVKTSGEFTGLVSATTYDPYGKVIFSLGENTSFGFTGETQDQSLNDMVYLRARYYAPSMGTFLSRDTWNGDANLPMSYNKWAYTFANPVNYTDPSGLDPIDDIAKMVVDKIQKCYFDRNVECVWNGYSILALGGRILYPHAASHLERFLNKRGNIIYKPLTIANLFWSSEWVKRTDTVQKNVKFLDEEKLSYIFKKIDKGKNEGKDILTSKIGVHANKDTEYDLYYSMNGFGLWSKFDYNYDCNKIKINTTYYFSDTYDWHQDWVAKGNVEGAKLLQDDWALFLVDAGRAKPFEITGYWEEKDKEYLLPDNWKNLPVPGVSLN